MTELKKHWTEVFMKNRFDELPMLISLSTLNLIMFSHSIHHKIIMNSNRNYIKNDSNWMIQDKLDELNTNDDYDDSLN